MILRSTAIRAGDICSKGIKQAGKQARDLELVAGRQAGRSSTYEVVTSLQDDVVRLLPAP